MVTPINKNSSPRKGALNLKIVSSQQKQASPPKNPRSRSLGDRFHRYRGEKLKWWQVISRIIGTVIPHILHWVLLCGAYGVLIFLLDRSGILSSVKEIKALPQIVVALNVVLSLLLVFRTNTAHDRFWEGRKLWGSMVNRARNLSRGIWIYIQERGPSDRTEKEKSMKLVAAFPIAMKLHLRREAMNPELEPLLSPQQYERILQASHGPLEIAFWIADYLQYQYERQDLNIFQLVDLQKMVDDSVDILGACERILKTPVPLIYTITLKILLFVYFLIVPLGLVESLGWETGPAMAFISLMFLTINEIGSEIEEPFGKDPNDLPLDFICNTIQRNVEDLIYHAPSSSQLGFRSRKVA
jgi:putative membrane protein